MGYMPPEFNYGYYTRVSYEADVNSYFRSKAANKLIEKLRNLIAV